MLPYIKVLLCYYDARVWAPPLKGGRGMFMYTFNNQYFMIKYLLSNV